MNIHDKIERGCEVAYAGEYTASAGWNYDIEGVRVWGISYQQDEMPAFDRKSFATEAELIAEMRTVAPLNHWRISRYDE